MNIEDYKLSLNNVTFYDAIVLDAQGAAYIDMDLAKIIWMDILRKHREIKFKYLDILSLRALESNDNTALDDVIAKKNILRDMPKNYDLSSAQFPEDLLIMFPDYLL